MGQVAPNPFGSPQYQQDPFYVSNNFAPPAKLQMAVIAQQQAFMMQQQQLQPMGTTNPFANPYEVAGISSSYPSHDPNTSLI